jgi:hypothetical protein
MLKSLMERLLFIVLFLASSIVSGVGYYLILAHLKWEPPRSLYLFWSLIIAVIIMGATMEDRFIWHGFLDQQKSRYLRPAPPPLSIGIIMGIIAAQYLP